MKDSNGLYYSGAGVLIIEDYYTTEGYIEECVLLVRNLSSGLYTDFGGTYETKHSSLQITAHMELMEESRNLFNVDPRHLTLFVDVPVRDNEFYRVHLIKINGTCRKYFRHNRKLMEKLLTKGIHIPSYWRETDDIAHIPFKNIDFNILSAKGKLILKDIEGRDVTLHNRAKKVMYYSQAMIFNVAKLNPIARKKDIIIVNSKDWTNGTYSYIIK